MSTPSATRRAFWSANALLILFPLVKLGAHLATLEGYGWFRDELYYLACADHLAWGYVDHPPLSIAVLWVVTRLFGDSLVVVRLVPALAGAATVLFTGLTVRELGGGRFAEAVAMLSALVAPIFLTLHHFYSMNALRTLVWIVVAWLVARILRLRDTRGPVPVSLWVALGVVLGLGLLNKVSVLWLGAGLAVGLFTTRYRRFFLGPGPWLAAGIAFALFLPHLVWQVVHGWPTLEFMANARELKMVAVGPLAFVAQQILVLLPATTIVWIAGVAWLFSSRRYRPLGWMWLTIFVLLVLARTARPDYLAPAALWLFAAGGVAWEEVIERLRRPWRPLIQAAGLASILAMGLVIAPMGLPVLEPAKLVEWQRDLGLAPPASERQELGALPQHWADMHGWPELVDEVERVWNALPPEDRERAAIFAQNYGEAGAIDHLGRERGLPRALSGHNAYWMWGPGEATGEVVIVLGDDRETLEGLFREVERAGTVECTWCMPYENDLPVWVVRGLRQGTLEALWPEIKSYI